MLTIIHKAYMGESPFLHNKNCTFSRMQTDRNNWHGLLLTWCSPSWQFLLSWPKTIQGLLNPLLQNCLQPISLSSLFSSRRVHGQTTFTSYHKISFKIVIHAFNFPSYNKISNQKFENVIDLLLLAFAVENYFYALIQVSYQWNCADNYHILVSVLSKGCQS